MYRFSGMGVMPGSGRIAIPTDGTVASSGRDAGLVPVVRTGGMPTARPTVFGYPDDSLGPVPEQVAVQDQGEDTGTPQFFVSSSVPVVSSTAAASSVAVSSGISIPWWGWLLGAGALLWAVKGGR